MRRSEDHEYRRVGQCHDEWLYPSYLTKSYFNTSTSIAGGNSLMSEGSEPVETRVSQQNRDLKCVSINARRLVNKAPEFMAWADTNCYNIIAVTET